MPMTPAPMSAGRKLSPGVTAARMSATTIDG